MTLQLTHARGERFLWHSTIPSTQILEEQEENKKECGAARATQFYRLEGPEFELTGTHVIIFVTALLTVAYFAGLLPDP